MTATSIIRLERLFKSIEMGDLDSIDNLIKNGADVVSERPVPHPRAPMKTTLMTPLGWAAYVSNTQDLSISQAIFSTLLTSGADQNLGKPILFASTAHSIEWLLSTEANPNVRMYDGSAGEHGGSALMFRAAAHDIASLSLLISAGADATHKTASSLSVLDYAIVGEKKVTDSADVDLRIKVIDTLSVSPLDIELYTLAVLSVADIDILVKTTVVNPGPPPTEGVNYSRRQISLRPILERLAYYGGDPGSAIESSAGSARRNILMKMFDNLAFRYEPFDEISWLARRYGYSLFSHADHEGLSSLHKIFWSPPNQYSLPKPETVRLVQLLLSYNADPNFRDNRGATPLHRLVRAACRKKGRLHPFPFPCDQTERSDVKAACNECKNAAKIIIGAGGDASIKDFSGKSARDEARERPNCPIASVLMLNSLTLELEEIIDKRSEADRQIERGEPHANIVFHPLSKVDELDIDELWIEESDSLVNSDCFPAQSDMDDRLVALDTAVEDPQASGLHPQAHTLYVNANKHYRSTSGHVDPYIRINGRNARRSTIHQAQLYEAYIFFRYYGGPGPQPMSST